VSGRRLTPDEFFGGVPFRFTDALEAGEIDGLHYLLGCLLVTLCFRERHTRGGVAIVKLLTLADRVNVPGVIEASTETIRRRLHDLHGWGWIECETRTGPDATWRVRLLRLDFQAISTEEGSSEWKLISTGTSAEAESDGGAKADAEPGLAAPEAAQVFPLEADPRTPRRDETIRDKRNPGFEDQRKVLGPLREDENKNPRPIARIDEDIRRILIELPEWQQAPPDALLRYARDLRRLGAFDSAEPLSEQAKT